MVELKKDEYVHLASLTDEQAEASAPQSDVWLAASAGTGKTQVLAARVLRLLLNKAKPESILCLTFTKGGAAEMAERVYGRLAKWVRAQDKEIRADLFSLGEKNDDKTIAYARTLFARVLDARGGGLRIQTIHAFCQTLLSGFPAEAGLTAGFRPLEERESAQLAHEVLSDLVAGAEGAGELGFLERFERTALHLGEEKVLGYLMACARKHRALEDLGGGIEEQVRRELGVPDGDVEEIIATGCEDVNIDRAGLERVRDVNQQWKTAAGTGAARAAAITQWLASAPEERAVGLDDLIEVWLTQKNAIRSASAGLLKIEPDYAALCARVHAPFGKLITLRKSAALAAQIADALRVGQRFAQAFAEAKRSVGGVDFDDLIEITARLLRTPGMGEWIKYKLDQQTDHILVDEGQDTNAAQWDIVQALAEEFYAGEGAKSGARRTIFTVGDTKQAIFGFQGSDPAAMGNARTWFEVQAQGAGRDLLDLDLSQSYRSSPPILALVDAVSDVIGWEAMGLERPPAAHSAAKGRAGHIMLLPPVAHEEAEVADDSDDDEGQESATALILASDIAKRVAGWLHPETGLWIEDRKAPLNRDKSIPTRRLEAKDVMILLRSRAPLAPLLVARLHEAGVTVAGVDRLRLNAPLVVLDVLAAIRFALQPHDDLNLACLLVSPLIGWSQNDVQQVAIARARGTSLWRHLRDDDATPQALRALLNMGDRYTPSRFIEALLSGDLRGRFKLIERFGEEARDPLDELMNAALAFERAEVPSLQGFLSWFERGDIDIKRDAEAEGSAVRVLTVHGAKGLQAPLVILADATKNPQKKQPTLLDWALEGNLVPIPRPRAGARFGSVEAADTAFKQRENAEHWRLLYVALTRAEERLVIAGTMAKKKTAAPEESWHAKIETALAGMGAEADAEGVIAFGAGALPSPKTERHPELDSGSIAPKIQSPRPLWLDAPAPAEARPPRPLSPSALTRDDTPNPPPSAAAQQAMRRGSLLHALFERLPAVAPHARAGAAEAWLASSAAVTDSTERATLISDALRVIDDPAFAAVFGADALAEAPVAGIVDGVVIAGAVDRLLITDTHITVVDFKTGRFVPQSPESINAAHLRQMAAYAAVLGGIFPNHHVSAALLYTSAPKMFTLTADQLAPHKPSFQLEQQVLGEGA